MRPGNGIPNFLSPIPDKLYFKIGEVSQLVGVEPHVLRYWEKEVGLVRPSKSASQQRRYRYRDVEIFRQVRRLLYDEKFTLAGAKQQLLSEGTAAKQSSTGVFYESVSGPGSPEPTPVDAGKLQRLRAGLSELLRLVEDQV